LITLEKPFYEFFGMDLAGLIRVYLQNREQLKHFAS